jgi:hypothetical protein
METLEAPDDPSTETDRQDGSETNPQDESQQKDEDLW